MMCESIDLNKVVNVESDDDDDDDDFFISNKKTEEECGVVDHCDKESQVSLANYLVQVEQDLKRAMVDTERQAYLMYCDYAHALGFSVRKGKNDFFTGTTQLRAKLFTCSKEGKKGPETGKGESSKSDGRTGCEALIWFTREKDGPLKVTRWIKEHNHEMARFGEKHLLRSYRSIAPSVDKLIESQMNAGVRPIDSYNMIVEDCGGPQNVGCTKKDMYNYVSLLKSTKIEAGDCQSVINHFKDKTSEEDMFYWSVQLDTEGRGGECILER